MLSSRRALLFAILSTAVVSGCNDEGSVDNDKTGKEIESAKDGGKSTAKDAGKDSGKVASKDAGKDTGTSGGDDGDDDDSGDDDMGDDDSSGEKDAGKPPMDSGSGATERDSSTPAPATDSGSKTDPAEAAKAIKGTAKSANCQSFTKPADGMCGTWYCGVTEEQITAALPDNACGTAAQACEGRLPLLVGGCARDALTAHPEVAISGDTDSLRPDVLSCIREDEEFKDAPEDCLNCFVDVASCAGTLDTCLLDCAAGDSPECDTCRLNNNCDPTFPACAHLPDPF